ncbi:unnamed protein product [Pylaiella littoralis]
MVVLSASITTRNGKALLARQFVDMSRIRIEGLLAAFPKLMGTGNKQHTFIETETVRYVYQPIENLFLLLVTNKASNIVEDLETLRMLSKVVPDVAGGLTEEKVQGKAFELVFAFDEVITTGGHKESISLQQIKTNMEMDSHEERLYNMIQDSKREAAKEEAGRRAKELREKQKEALLRGSTAGGMSGIGGGSGGGGGGGSIGMSGSSMYTEAPDQGSTSSWGQSYGAGGSSGASAGLSVPSAGLTSSTPVADTRVSTQGMKLGGASKSKNILETLIKEDHLVSIPSAHKASGGGAEAAVPAAVVAASVNPVSLSVEERLSCQLTREGTLESMEVKGTLSLTANSDGANKCKVVLASTDASGLFTFQTHPKVNKGMYDSAKTLASKDQAKGFPVARPVGVLRWSLNTTDESQMPLTINCWPEAEGGGQMNVSMEYELVRPMELHDVRISIPLGSSAVPEIAAIDGSHRHITQEGTLLWTMDLLDQSNRTGSLEFNIASRDPEAFFPITVTFASTQLFCNVQVAGVVNTETEAPIQYGYTASLTADSYTVS